MNKLMTIELEEQLPRLYSTENVPVSDKVVRARFFTMGSNLEWYAVEYDVESGLFFGYVYNTTETYFSEWGYFSLDEFIEVNKYYGFDMVMRDEDFEAVRFGTLKRKLG